MKNQLEAIFKEFTETSEKLAKGYETLSAISAVEIATAEKETVWQEDKIKLYRYKSDKPATCKVPLLISYALVNRYEMMDLQPDRSIIRKLLSLGVDIYLIDWGYASRAERFLTMDDYINGYIDSCVEFIRKEHNISKVNLLGVCQGGTFSVIYSALHPEKVNALITLVAPFDFDTKDALLFRWSRDLDVDKIVDAHGGIVPGEFLNFAFDMLKPMSKVKKYTGIVNSLDDKDKMLNFLRMEKWVADSPDQAGECFRQFIKDLYQQNKLIKGELRIGGHKVDLKKITMPVLTIYASEDHLVPPAATKPLNEHIGSADKQLYEFPGGHIGVFVGARSQKELGPTISEWLHHRSR